MKIKSSERNRLSLLPARAPLLPPHLPPAPSPPCLLPLVSGPTQHRLCSVFPHPLHGPWVFGLKHPSLLAPLSSSLKYVQIFLILKKKRKKLPWPHIPSYYFLFTADFFKNFSILRIATSPMIHQIHLSSCHFSATALPESMQTFFYITHRAWADLTAPEHLRPSWSSRTAPFLCTQCITLCRFPSPQPQLHLGFLSWFPSLDTPLHHPEGWHYQGSILSPLLFSLRIFLLGDPMASLVT